MIGTFNDWNETATSLFGEKNGYWSTEVSEAKAGDEYRYLLHGLKGPLSRIDPYARKVTNATGNGIIYDPKAFDWGNNNFHMATGDELVIYEMHIGTFNVKEEGQPGTFDSAIEKLPYLQQLGINAVEVMPIAEFSVTFRGATIRVIPLLLKVFMVGRMPLSDWLEQPTSMVLPSLWMGLQSLRPRRS